MWKISKDVRSKAPHPKIVKFGMWISIGGQNKLWNDPSKLADVNKYINFDWFKTVLGQIQREDI